MNTSRTRCQNALEVALLKYEEDEVRYRLNETHLLRQIEDRERRIHALERLFWELSETPATPELSGRFRELMTQIRQINGETR